jgi:DNA-binding transcriptional MerR regulator
MAVGSMRISELAERAEVPVSTLRYYERIGLLPSPERLLNGYRVYDESAIEHLAFIGRAKRMGVPLEQVSELIELWWMPPPPRAHQILFGRKDHASAFPEDRARRV